MNAIVEPDPFATSRHILRESLLKAIAHLTGGTPHRVILLGIWYCAIGTLFEVSEPDDIERFLTVQIARIKGLGINADTPHYSTGDGDVGRQSHGLQAAEIVGDFLGDAYEELVRNDLQDLFPELLFGEVISVILPIWGPVPVRKSLARQIDAIQGGLFSAIVPFEPLRLDVKPQHTQPARPTVAQTVGVGHADNQGAHPPSLEPEKPHSDVEDDYPEPPSGYSEADDPEEVDTIETTVLQEEHGTRDIDVHFDVDVDGLGRSGVFSAAVRITFEDRDYFELREIGGRIDDSTERRAILKAALAIFREIQPVRGDHIRIAMYSDLIQSVFVQGRPKFLNEVEWSELEELSQIHSVKWSVVPRLMGNELRDRCDLNLLRCKGLFLAAA